MKLGLKLLIAPLVTAVVALSAGTALSDVAGPLGRPTHIVPGARVCAIGG